jgi:hypothetical protein
MIRSALSVTEDYLQTVARKLRRKIPAPRAEPAKPQDSWHLLKPGQFLRSKVVVETLPGIRLSDGTLWEVRSCTNKGVLLTARGLQVSMGKEPSCLWNDKNWKASFERVRAKKVKEAR